MGMPREKMMIEATTQEKLCKDYFDCMVAFDELVEHDQVCIPGARLQLLRSHLAFRLLSEPPSLASETSRRLQCSIHRYCFADLH